MGSVGDAYDNAMIESFWGTIKTELLYRHVWPTRHEAEMAIFEWIEGWYNRERLHSSLGYLSPQQYEQQHHDRPTNRLSRPRRLTEQVSGLPGDPR